MDAEKITEALLNEASIWQAASRLRSMAFMLGPESGMAKQSAGALYDLVEEWLKKARAGDKDAEQMAPDVWKAAQELESIRLEFHRVTGTIHKVYDRLRNKLEGINTNDEED